MRTLLVTGGAGFIGSAFVRMALQRTDDRIVVLDKLTYAGSRENLAGADADPRVSFVVGDIADRETVARVFAEFAPGAVLNFAAESHVDRSIDGPRPFLASNVVGAFELLEASRRMLAGAADAQARAFRFLHVSTDEVYGSLGPAGAFTEETPYAPNSPYSATKAAADHLARAYHETYRLPVLVTNCSNNYGPYQFPEKLIPVAILNALEGKPIPVYGDGLYVRDWLHVDDHCEGLLRVLEAGIPGRKYNLGGDSERTNLEIVQRICEALEARRPAASNPALAAAGVSRYTDLKRHVEDRLGHDRRYAIDSSRIRAELGWAPRRPFETGLAETVSWYLEHRDWVARRQAEARYQRERLGVTR
jgi:dTDP-glucose 4,6-dehydratase